MPLPPPFTLSLSLPPSLSLSQSSRFLFHLSHSPYPFPLHSQCHGIRTPRLLLSDLICNSYSTFCLLFLRKVICCNKSIHAGRVFSGIVTCTPSLVPGQRPMDTHLSLFSLDFLDWHTVASHAPKEGTNNTPQVSFLSAMVVCSFSHPFLPSRRIRCPLLASHIKKQEYTFPFPLFFFSLSFTAFPSHLSSTPSTTKPTTTHPHPPTTQTKQTQWLESFTSSRPTLLWLPSSFSEALVSSAVLRKSLRSFLCRLPLARLLPTTGLTKQQQRLQTS